MKIDDSKLIRFINNDLPKFEKKELDSLIKNDPKLEFKLQGLKNFLELLIFKIQEHQLEVFWEFYLAFRILLKLMVRKSLKVRLVRVCKGKQ